MIFKSMGATAKKAYELAQPRAEAASLRIWDVTFEKEGAAWYLRVFLEREESKISIEDCEHFSRELSCLLDECDLVEQRYFLEVSSPGIERELTKPEHFEKYIGEKVRVKIIRPIDGRREFLGDLLGATKEQLKILSEGEVIVFNSDRVAKVQLFFEF